MADDNDTDNDNDLRLSILKDRAKTLGISHSPNISVETLKKKIDDHINGRGEQEAPSAKKLSKEQMVQEERAKQKLEQLALVRCKINNLDPRKNDLNGEIITVINKYLGPVRKFVPFGEATENGYHIPKIILEELRSRKFQQIKTKRQGENIIVTPRQIAEYSIEILDPLTQEELRELAMVQSAANRLAPVES